jgi:hypothetical protein
MSLIQGMLYYAQLPLRPQLENRIRRIGKLHWTYPGPAPNLGHLRTNRVNGGINDWAIRPIIDLRFPLIICCPLNGHE